MSKNTKLHPVSITILGKEYRVACTEDEQESLINTAHELDKQMHQIRDSGKVNGADRIAVMAALNLTHELRQAQSKSQDPGVSSKENISDKLAYLRHKIENVLEIF